MGAEWTPPPEGVLLSADEWHLLARYREIRDSGQGMLVVEFAGHRVTKYKFEHAGDVRLMNQLIGNAPLRD